MQLKKKKFKFIKKMLTTATFSLLGITEVALGKDHTWNVETGIVHYSEQNRISVTELILDVEKEIVEKEILNVKFTVDSITGASPNGATSTKHTQTFTGPSGKNSYTSPPNEIPLNKNVSDFHIGLDMGFKKPIKKSIDGYFTTSISRERDFESYNISGAISKEYDQKNITLSAGVAFEYDKISPRGGIPIEMSKIKPNNPGVPSLINKKNKSVIDLLMGLTQVINRFAIIQFNYSISRVSGYSTDPYKIISVINSNTGETTSYIHEGRPTDRFKQSLFSQTKIHLNRDMFSFSYRYHWDNWGISSDTIDFRYHWKFLEHQAIEPHLRFYKQDKANFYTYRLKDLSPFPENASADYRLADLQSLTYGFKYFNNKNIDSSWVIRIEVYTQKGTSKQTELIGKQKISPEFPKISAIIFQLLYSY